MAGHWDDEQSIDSKGEKTNPKTRTIYPWELLRFATSFELFIFFAGCLGAVGTGSGLPVMSILMGTTTQAFTDLALTGDYGAFSHAVEKSCVQFSILGGGIYICAIIQCLCSVYVCDRMIDRLRRRFLSSILRQDITWFDKNHSGTLAPKLFDNLERVREGSGDKIALMVQMLSQFIGGYVVAFAHNWSLTLILLSLTPFIMVCGAYVGKMMANAAIMEASMYGIAGGIAEEVLTSIRTVVAFNGQEFESERYHSALKDGRRAGIIKNIKSGVGIGLTFFFMMSSIGLAFYVGTTYVAEGKTDGGTVLTVFFSVLLGSMALGNAGPQFAVIGTAMGAAASIYEVVDRKPEIDAYSTEGVKPKNLKGKITVQNVHFAYPTRPDVPILKGVSLTAQPGQTIALVGSSGSGKSTIIQLLLRYYAQLSGTIKIDDHRIEDINLEYLRNYLGVVSQEPNLFATTIEENIRYGRKDVTEAEIVEALKLANAYAFVKKFPQGIHTLVGDRGAQLSGGQKQRIAIARALVRNPKVLLLDEATSALDAQSEHVVQKALDNAAKGRTTIVIAHRLSTIRNADQIIAMKDGKVIEVGTHDSLLPLKGLYYELVNAQVFTDIDHSKSEKRRMSVMSNRSRAETEMEESHELAEFVDHSAIEDNAARLKREAKEENVKPASLIEIIRRSRPEWFNLAIGFIASAIQGCVFPSFALIFVQLIQTFAEPEDQMKKDGHFWALFFVLEGIIMLVTMFLQCTFFGAASERVAMRFRSRVFRNVLRQDAYYFDQPKHSAGKIVTRLANDAPSLKAALDFRLGSAFSAVVGVIFGVGVAFYFGWQMACLTVVLFPLVAVGQAIQQFLLLGDSTGSANELANSGKTAMEAIENIRTVQALTMQQTIYDQFCKYISKPLKHTLRSAIIQGVVYGFATSITFFIFAACFRFGLWLIVNNTLEPYNVLKVLFATQFCAQSLGMFSGYFPEYSRATFAAGLIFSMLDKKPKIDGITESGKKPKLAGNIAVKDVHFRYPQRPDIPILRGLNVSVNTGETLALVGPSGCGKSTIIGLLERLYDVLDGQLEVDGHDVRSLNPKHLRSQISLVSQEPVLFDRSIRENIIYGLKESVTQEQIEEACKKSNIHEFILKQPDGYNTRVGERGGQLSGGQKQRIAIARALVRDPRILLLDEATSALDTESEKVVQEALNKASVGRTCIVIAHRLSTIVDANCIAVVDKGKIIEQGTHAELIQKRGVYFDLASKQAGSKH